MPPLAALLPNLPSLAGVALAGYVLGSLPFGYWVAKAHGVDIFTVGSGSPGATNVGRAVGGQAGKLVFALDAVKGVVAAGWPLLWQGVAAGGWPRLWTAQGFALACGITGLVFALLGHSFSCFTRFRGGKGVATGAGGFLVLMPPVTVIAAAVWVVSFLTSRYVSLASLAAAVAMPLGSLIFGEPEALTLIAVVIAGFVAIRHRANIARLLAGTEHRWQRKPGGSAP